MVKSLESNMCKEQLWFLGCSAVPGFVQLRKEEVEGMPDVAPHGVRGMEGLY